MKIVKTPRSRAFALADFLLTALAWLVFCSLFAAGIQSIFAEGVPGIAVPFVSRLLPHAHTLLVYSLVAAGFSLLLLAWANYNALRYGGLDRRKPPLALPRESLACSFGVSPAQVGILQARHAVRIHHTEQGQISLLDFDDSPPHPAGNVVQLPR